MKRFGVETEHWHVPAPAIFGLIAVNSIVIGHETTWPIGWAMFSMVGIIIVALKS